VTQTAGGTTTLSRAAGNTYTGGTTLTAGTLLVTNTSGSATGTGAVTTAAGTTLGGTGTLAPTGTHGVSLSGAVTPGLTGSAGTLSFVTGDGNVSFLSGSSAVLELFGNGSNDRVSFQSLSSGLLDFSGMQPGGLSVVFSGGFTPQLGHVFDLLDWSALSGSGVAGLNEALLAPLPTTGFDPEWIWDTSLFTTSGQISVAQVPEPGRVLLLGLGLAALTLPRRRALRVI
jgi:hypothetical protein